MKHRRCTPRRLVDENHGLIVLCDSAFLIRPLSLSSYRAVLTTSHSLPSALLASHYLLTRFTLPSRPLSARFSLASHPLHTRFTLASHPLSARFPLHRPAPCSLRSGAATCGSRRRSGSCSGWTTTTIQSVSPSAHCTSGPSRQTPMHTRQHTPSSTTLHASCSR